MGAFSWLIRGKTASEVITELRRRLDGRSGGRLAVYFAGVALERNAVAEGVAESLPGAQTIGVSSVRTIHNQDMADDHSLSIMVFDDGHVADARVELMEGTSAGADPEPAFGAFRRYFKDDQALADPGRYVGLVLADPFNMGDQMVIERLGDRSDVMFVGGSASDGGTMKDTWVAANGKAAGDAAAVALLRPARPFRTAKVQSVKALQNSPALMATKVDPATGAVLEFNDRPAIDAFAEAFGVKPAEVDNEFMDSHQLGLSAEGDWYVRDGRLVLPGGGLLFYAKIREGQKLSALEPTDMVADIASRQAEIHREWGRPTAVLEFCCLHRYMTLMKQRQSVEPYLSLHGDTPLSGFVTFGEAYFGHVNCTSTYLLLG